jgi:hypothetical protein
VADRINHKFSQEMPISDDNNRMDMHIYCLVDKCHWSNESTQYFVVASSLEEAVKAFQADIASPNSKYNLASAPAKVETSLELELTSRSGQWDKVGYLKFQINQSIPRKLPVFVTSLRPNMVFN